MEPRMTKWLLTRLSACLIVYLLPASSEAKDPTTPIIPLRNAHAHNDYEHPHPLRDALDHGFCSVEADIFLRNGELLVGHAPKDLKPDRTLQSLYLEPLRRRVLENNGRVYLGGPTVYLLIDVKSEPEATYSALHKVLASYSDILSVTRNGKFAPRAVTAVISGNRAIKTMSAQRERYAGIDGRTSDLESEIPVDLMPWISDRWSLHFRWNGEGKIPAAERARLVDFVERAHRHGRLVRFWATPEQPAVWKELRAAGVDLINTDKLSDLRDFLLKVPSP
jgi:hypothetical protein